MSRGFKLTRIKTRRVLGMVLGSFVLVFGALASGAAVYHSLHHDAASHSASCAICSFANGQVEAADGTFVVPQPAAIVDFAVIPTVSPLPPNRSFLLPPGRAPPALTVVS